MSDTAERPPARRERFWTDADGTVVIVQIPNLPLIGWLAFAVVARLLDAGQGRSGAAFASSAFLFTWAYLELTQGVNYFRRLMGAAVLLFAVISHFR